VFKILKIKNIHPEVFLAPRGLITILLFYAIPVVNQNDNFDPGVLLFIIISSSLAMTFSLVGAKKRQNLEVPFPDPPMNVEKKKNKLQTDKHI
jgi:hypothetical protein